MRNIDFTQDGPESYNFSENWDFEPVQYNVHVDAAASGEKTLGTEGDWNMGPSPVDLSLDIDDGAQVELTINALRYTEINLNEYSGPQTGTTMNFKMGWDTQLNFNEGFADAFRGNEINIDMGPIPWSEPDGDGGSNNSGIKFDFGGTNFEGFSVPNLTNVVRGRIIQVEGSTKFAYEDGNLVFRNDQDVVVGKFHAEGLDPDSFWHTPGSSSITYACFLKGTHIAIPDGEVKVENLKAGDKVVTTSGGVATVKWIGYRTLYARQIPVADAKRAFPVLLKKNSIADNIPHRDLVVSPGHHLFFDGNLIPAMALVNDLSIIQLFDMPAFQYFHVELEQFDILLAEGVPAESYVDTGNRKMFQNAKEVELNPDFGPKKRRPKTPGIAVVREGAILEAVRAKLLERTSWTQHSVLEKRAK